MAQGFVYVLDCEGRSVEGWPLQMGEVQAQVGSPPWLASSMGGCCPDLCSACTCTAWKA